jgi:hypothetical protein
LIKEAYAVAHQAMFFFLIARCLKFFNTLTMKEAVVYVIVHALIIITSYGFHYGIASTRKQLVVLDRVGWLAGEQDFEWRRNTLIFLHGQRLQFQPWLQ